MRNTYGDGVAESPRDQSSFMQTSTSTGCGFNGMLGDHTYYIRSEYTAPRSQLALRSSGAKKTWHRLNTNLGDTIFRHTEKTNKWEMLNPGEEPKNNSFARKMFSTILTRLGLQRRREWIAVDDKGMLKEMDESMKVQQIPALPLRRLYVCTR